MDPLSKLCDFNTPSMTVSASSLLQISDAMRMVKTVFSNGLMMSAQSMRMQEIMVQFAKLTTLCLLHSAMVRIQLNTAILCGAMFQLNALLSMLLFPLSHSSLLLESTSVIRLAVKNIILHLSLKVIFQLTQPLISVKLRMLKPLLKLKPPLLPLLELKLRLMLLLHRLLPLLLRNQMMVLMLTSLEMLVMLKSM